MRRAQILEAAALVCGEKGYHATRIDDIAERAGLSKGAVYHYFGSKQEVFLGVVDVMLDEMIAEVRRAVDADQTVAETLRRVTRMSLEMIDEQAGLLAGMFDLYVLSVRDPVFREHMSARYAEHIDATARLFARGVESGELRPVDPHDAASVYLMSADGIFLIHMVLDDTDAMKRRIQAHVEQVLTGLLAREGAQS